MITYTNKKHLNGLCSYCNAEETVEHVILYCAEYENEVLIIKLYEKEIHDMSLKKSVGKETRYERRGVAIYKNNKIMFENIIK